MSSAIYNGRDLKLYFRSLVEEAVYHQELSLSEMSKFYIVNLLNDFLKTDKLFDWKGDHYEETPLALQLKKALDSDKTTKIKVFKKIGDVSLYVAGYFSEHVGRQLVDTDYYISMGEGAFENLSGLFDQEKTFSELYDELSYNFTSLVDVLSEVRRSGDVRTNSELLRLYEIWLKTGDERIKERLEKEGINPQNISIVKKH